MANPMVVDLNFGATIARQENKCLQCKKEIDPNKDDLYFRMDQTLKPGLYEVYCHTCGLVWEKIDQEKAMIESSKGGYY